VRVEVCLPITRLAAHRPFGCKVGPTNQGGHHAVSRELQQWTSATSLATILGQWKALSGKFRIITQRTKTNAVTDGDDHGEVVLSE